MRTQIRELLNNAGFPSDDDFIYAFLSTSKRLPKDPIKVTQSLINITNYFKTDFEWDERTHWDMLDVVRAFIPWY